MKINSIKEQNVPSYTPNFKAKLQLRGNTKLVANDGIKTLKEIARKIGTQTDIIDIALPLSNRFIKNKANINIAAYVNGALEQFAHSIEKTSLLAGVVAGLERVEEIFTKQNTTANKASKKQKVTVEKASPKQNVMANKTSKKQEITIVEESPKQKSAVVAETSNQTDSNNIANKIPDFYISEKDAWDLFVEVADDLKQAEEYRKGYKAVIGKSNNLSFTKNNECMIHLVAKSNRTDLMKKLLNDPNINVNIRDCVQNTPLHIAAECNQVEQMKLLLARDDIKEWSLNKYDEYYFDNADDDALKFYQKYKKASRAKFWLDKKHTAKKTSKQELKNVTIKDPAFFIPEKDAWELFEEVADNLEQAEEYKKNYRLVAQFGNNHAFTKNNECMIHLVAMSNRTDLMKKLLSDPKIDINVKDHNGQTALFIAAELDKVEQLKLLLPREDLDEYTLDCAGFSYEGNAGDEAQKYIQEYFKDHEHKSRIIPVDMI